MNQLMNIKGLVNMENIERATVTEMVIAQLDKLRELLFNMNADSFEMTQVKNQIWFKACQIRNEIWLKNDDEYTKEKLEEFQQFIIQYNYLLG